MNTEIFYHPYVILAAAAILLIVVLEGIILIVWNSIKKRKKMRQKKSRAGSEKVSKLREQRNREIEEMLMEEKWVHSGEKPVISVEDVTMEFHLSSEIGRASCRERV